MTTELNFGSIEPMETIQASLDHLLRENPMGEARKGALRPIYCRLAGCDDTNDAERLAVDPAIRHVAGGRAIERSATSTSVMSIWEMSANIRPAYCVFSICVSSVFIA